MSLKTAFKYLVLGRSGLRPRRIHVGLLAGRRFLIDTASKSQRLIGLDEREIVRINRLLTAQCAAALDIGASDGWYSLYFASRPNIAQVLAFEPAAELLGRLRENFSLNDPSFADKLICHNKFVGNRDENGWCSVDRVVTDLPRPMLLKIDVEGGELDVLRGARGLLESQQVRLVVETHSLKLETDCLAYLQDLGYECGIIPNGWYRRILPEARHSAHNRWMFAYPTTTQLHHRSLA